MADSTTTKKDEILSDIEEKLKEEQWTRATIESYSVKNFVELDSQIRISINEGFKDDLKSICKEHLNHSQNSIVGLYVIGILSLEESSVDDAHIPKLIQLFMDNKKYKISEFLAEKSLSYRETKFALHTLEKIYEERSDEEELFSIKKRLVLIDSKDANNARFLGEFYEKEGDKDLAMFYYRLAIERYLRIRSVKMVEELWAKMVKLVPDDAKLIISITRKIREISGDEKVGSMLFEEAVKPKIKEGKYESALKLLKLVMDLHPHDKSVRKVVEECYTHIYEGHSQLAKYLKASAIGQSWKPHREAIRMFETHIAFDQGSHVFHKSWGIGTVRSIENDKVVIDFDKKKGHQMSLKIALRSLSVLDEDSIIIWKELKSDELAQLVVDDPIRVMKIVLKSLGGEANSKDIKSTLVPDIVEDTKWNRWWLITKNKMHSSNEVVQSLTKHNVFELRDTEVSVVEELVSKFKKSTNMESKIKVLIDFMDRGGDINQPIGQAMVNYFSEIINASSESTERQLYSYLALRYARYEGYKDENVDNSILFGMKNQIAFFMDLEVDLKRPFLELLKNRLKDWDVRFADFILKSPLTKHHTYMMDQLISYDKTDVLNNIFLTSINEYQDRPDLFVWLCKIFMLDEEAALMEKSETRKGDTIFRLISLIDMLNHESDQKTNVGRNKKLVNSINDLLFGNEILRKFYAEGDESRAKSVITLLYSSDTIDDDEKKKLINEIVEKYPHLKKIDKKEKVKIRHPFLVTQNAFNVKKQMLQNIMNEEIPANSKAIGIAMEKGDLRENAEYKSALEKQDQLKATASKLESELNQAKIIDPSKVSTNFVDVGANVVLKNQDGETESYSILGQWDVNFEKGIISYHSPLGRALLNKKKGDTLKFEFDGQVKDYEILDIRKADFE